MLNSKALNKMRGSLALFTAEGSPRGSQLRGRCNSTCFGARETVAGVREQSRVGGWGGEDGERGLTRA